MIPLGHFLNSMHYITSYADTKRSGTTDICNTIVCYVPCSSYIDSLCLDKGTRGVMTDKLEFKLDDNAKYSMFNSACNVLLKYIRGRDYRPADSHFVFFRAGDATLYYTYRHEATQRFFRFNGDNSELELVKEIDLPI